jgi:hypothetical protein
LAREESDDRGGAAVESDVGEAQGTGDARGANEME